MTNAQRNEAIKRANEIMATMSKEELQDMVNNPEMSFLAMCATMATTSA